MATDPPVRVTTDDLEALKKISGWIVQAYPTLARLARGDLDPLEFVSRDDYNAATDTIHELEEVITGADHTTAKYWRHVTVAERTASSLRDRLRNLESLYDAEARAHEADVKQLNARIGSLLDPFVQLERNWATLPPDYDDAWSLWHQLRLAILKITSAQSPGTSPKRRTTWTTGHLMSTSHLELTTAMRYEHGTRACYIIDRCHCDACRQANSSYELNRVRQKAYGRTRWCYSVDPVRDHIAQLRAAGYGTRTIADIAGIDRKTIQAIVSGMSRGRARQKKPAVRILKTTADAILAIELPDTDPIDQIAVQRVLDGQPPAHRLNHAERLEAVRLWHAAGRTQKDLERLTGWNIRHNVRTLRNEGIFP